MEIWFSCTTSALKTKRSVSAATLLTAAVSSCPSPPPSSQTLLPLVAMHVAATATSTAVTLPTSSFTVPTQRRLHHRCSQLHPRSTCFSLSAAQVSPDPRIKTWVKSVRTWIGNIKAEGDDESFRRESWLEDQRL